MRKFLIISVLLLSSYTQAQKITGFDLTKIPNEYGTYDAEIKPSIIDGNAPEDTRKWGLYGVLICYSVDGEARVLKQDITQDIVLKGVKSIRLNYGSNQKVEIYYWTHFYLPNDSGPSKESCGNHRKYN